MNVFGLVNRNQGGAMFRLILILAVLSLFQCKNPVESNSASGNNPVAVVEPYTPVLYQNTVVGVWKLLSTSTVDIPDELDYYIEFTETQMTTLMVEYAVAASYPCYYLYNMTSAYKYEYPLIYMNNDPDDNINISFSGNSMTWLYPGSRDLDKFERTDYSSLEDVVLSNNCAEYY
jgi:hypothetical protein